MAEVSKDSILNEPSSPLTPPPPSDSDLSELSELSRSPSPPPSIAARYPSPSPSSQRSSTKASPAPDNMPCGDDAGAPPRKKRKLADNKSRTTQRLDLRLGQVAEEEAPQLERLLKVLHKKRKIVVIAGAGISVSAGIPDFRSSTGLFTSLRKQHKLKSSGKDLFDASVYQDDSSTSSFHDMVRSLSQTTKNARPTAFHHLLATLAHEGRLLRLYSQNVDGIDTSLSPLKTQVPLPKKGPWPKTIQLHGGLDHMVCTKCHTLSDFDAELFNGPTPPACGQCTENDQVRHAAEKRSHGIGRLRPRMVLYNEHNPDDEAIGSCTKQDLRTRPDAVIVVGTTLKVPGIRRIAREMCAIVRDRRDGVSIWINNDPEPLGKDLAESWDLIVRGPCDEVARHAAMRRWDDPITYREVTEDEINTKKKQKNPVVLVASPQKRVDHVQEQMLTPAQSPRMDPRAMVKKEPTDEPSTPSKKSTKRKSEVQAQVKVAVFPPKQQAKPPPKRRQAQPKKATGTKGKAKNSRINEGTLGFKAAKSSAATKSTKALPKKASSTSTGAELPLTFIHSKYIGQESVKPEELLDTIHVASKTLPLPVAPGVAKSKTGLTLWKRESMAVIAPNDFRNNTSPLGSPHSPAMEPFTSPPCSPGLNEDRSFTAFSGSPQSYITAGSRPASSHSWKDQIQHPDGAVPQDMKKILC